MTDDADFDFEAYTVPVEGVHVSADGYYTCDECETVLEAQFETTLDDKTGRRRGIWLCPTCGSRFEI